MRNILSLAVLGLVAGAATAAAPKSDETVIPFINSLSNVEWKAVSDDSAYVRGGRGEWYLVRTSNRCTRLRTSLGLGFQTSALGQLDRHGALLVQGQRCPVASITRSGEPPRKTRRKAG